MPAQRTKKPVTLYNMFTKSYRFRYIVHAGVRNADRTVCNREVVKKSTSEFNAEVDGACKLCLKTITVQNRVHPGWE